MRRSAGETPTLPEITAAAVPGKIKPETFSLEMAPAPSPKRNGGCKLNTSQKKTALFAV